MRTFRFWPLAGTLLCACSFAHAADTVDDLSAALSGGKPNLDVRIRDEHVSSDAAATPDDANALTLRARLGYTTASWHAFDAQLEYEGTSAWDQDDYNSGTNGITNRPLIADPTGSELNQAWLRYNGLPWTTLKLGRQRYTLDNQRFIGNAGWRQNEQTFDGASAQLTPTEALTVRYAWFHNLNNVQFVNVPMNDTQLLNASYVFDPLLMLVGYGYWLDFKNPSTAANRQDSRTLGVRASGSHAANDQLKFSYVAEYAQQRDYADAPDSVDADYWTVEGGVSWSFVQARLGVETLGSNDGLYGFQTPLATLHAFNGWADLFTVTPTNGLRDSYVHLSATQWQTTATVVWHRYDADHGDARYGDEWDASLSRPLTKQLCVLAKYAHYKADDYGADTEKIWLQAEFKI